MSGVSARVWIALAGLAALGTAAWLLAWPGDDAPEVRATLSLVETLGGADTAGYARADRVVPFDFPEDHGAHPDFRTEWWYLTGNLEGADGRRFGYQLTLFRNSLSPTPVGGSGGPAPAEGRTADGADPTGLRADATSRWATSQAWMGHLAVTDAEAKRFYAFERFERGALELAGVETEPFRVWVGPWEIAGAGGRDEIFPLRVRASVDSVEIELTLGRGKGIVLQGDRGLSRKGPEPGNASYYYTMPRLPTEGRVRTPAGRFDIRGASWLDREWSTSALSEGVAGWDWFALQLDDGRDLMVYGLRRGDGSFTEASEGLLVLPDGTTRRLARDDFSLVVEARWRSPVDGAEYPGRWRLRVPSAGLDLRVRPVLADQELVLAFRYWEGAVDVRTHPDAEDAASGRGAKVPDAQDTGGGPASVTGRGYVELTGYAGEEPPGR